MNNEPISNNFALLLIKIGISKEKLLFYLNSIVEYVLAHSFYMPISYASMFYLWAERHMSVNNNGAAASCQFLVIFVFLLFQFWSLLLIFMLSWHSLSCWNTFVLLLICEFVDVKLRWHFLLSFIFFCMLNVQ